MAVSIKELIEKKETMEAKKQETYDLETSIGTITCSKPTQSFMAELADMKDNANEYGILNLCVDPNLKDTSLQQAYGCVEPTDIVGKLFDAGEIISISNKLAELSGYGKKIETKVHEDIKN